MNLTTTGSALPELTIPLILEVQASGAIAASTPAFPDCRVEAATRDEAIAHLKTALTDRLSHVELIAWKMPVPGQPAKPVRPPFVGIFENDPDFAEIMEQLRAERESEDDSEVDPAYYLETE